MPLRQYTDVAAWFGKITVSFDAYRRENEALRLMLIEKGLTQAQIRREVKRRVQRLEPFEEAHVLCRKVCEEIHKQMQEHDPLEKLAEKIPKMDKGKMS